MTRQLSFLPEELQLRLLSFLDDAGLASVCRVNRSLSAKATPILWRDIQLEAVLSLAQRFFVACDSIFTEQPERWQQLASHVRSLNIGNLPGIVIPIGQECHNGCPQLAWVGSTAIKYCKRTVYDVIAGFKNLTELHLFIVMADDMDDPLPEFKEPPEICLPALKRLNIGGCIDERILEALFNSPERLEECSSIYPQSAMAGQGCGPLQRVFLSGLESQFSHLTKLHLCKMGELVSYDDGLDYMVESENDREIHKDWAEFLAKVSKSLVHLTLEARYPVYSEEHFEGYDNRLFSGKDSGKSPDDWGVDSREEFQEIVLPVIATQAWPNLRSLVLIGMDTAERNVKVTHALAFLQPRVEIRFELAKTVIYNYEVTPMTIDPPDGYFQGY